MSHSRPLHVSPTSFSLLCIHWGSLHCAQRRQGQVQGVLFLQKAVQLSVEYMLRNFAGWGPY